MQLIINILKPEVLPDGSQLYNVSLDAKWLEKTLSVSIFGNMKATCSYTS